MTQKELNELLGDMSLEEKIGQLVQVPGSCYEESAVITGGMNNGWREETCRLAGSTLGIYGAKKLKKIQDEYMRTQPHHIPLLFMLDVIHGHRTVFPCPLGQGATFSPETSEECAKVAAKESGADGVQVTFAPMADLVRDSRWGRVMESTGEDPYLNSLMAAAMVKGFQGDDVGEKGRIASCIKHVAAYGGAVAGLDYQNVELSEHTLREFYLPAYKAAVDAGCELAMTSFNLLNGVPSSGNKWLMRDVLRGEWGFEGAVICDFNSSSYMNTKQMAYAGGDLNLANTPMRTRVWADSSSAADVTVLRNCAKNILFATANSNAINRDIAGYRMPVWQVVMIVVICVIVAGLAVWGVFAVRGALRKPENSGGEQA